MSSSSSKLTCRRDSAPGKAQECVEKLLSELLSLNILCLGSFLTFLGILNQKELLEIHNVGQTLIFLVALFSISARGTWEAITKLKRSK